MQLSDPNREQLVKVAQALGGLSSEVVFLGGATVGLLITDPAVRSVRPTKDVDVVVEVASYAEYQVKIGSVLRNAGFVECTDEDAPICAWKVDGIRVDVMPTDAAVLGFTNPWYQGAIATAVEYDLAGTKIRLIAAPYFLATKFVAFAARGGGDYYGSHDLEDILAVVDGQTADDRNSRRQRGHVDGRRRPRFGFRTHLGCVGRVARNQRTHTSLSWLG